MKKLIALTSLLSALAFSGPAFAQTEAGTRHSPAKDHPPGKVQLVIDVYSAWLDPHQDAIKEKDLPLWLQSLKRTGVSGFPNYPKLLHRRIALEKQKETINEEVPGGDSGPFTLKAEVTRRPDGRVHVAFSSLGRPGAKPIGDDEKDKHPISTELTLQVDQPVRVLALPEVSTRAQPIPSETEPRRERNNVSPEPIETLVIVLRLDKAQDNPDQSPYEVSDPS